MTTYNLDETPHIFIAPYENKKMRYQKVNFKEWPKHSIIGDINLDKDKLIIHGTEIKEHMFQKLYDSLRLGAKGTVFVNCNGACYIWMLSVGFDRLHHNVRFDWSPFGVTVPNSVDDLLRKELQQKDKEVVDMTSLLATAKGEASANKEGWEASKQEVEELKELLLACRMEQLDKDVELQKVLSQQRSVKEFELEAAKFKVELFKEIKERHDQVSDTNKKNYRNVEMELHMVQHQLFNSRMENEDMKEKLQSIQDQVFSVVTELQSTKIELASSNKNMVELVSRHFSRLK
ncbi:hypothetical protein BVRB_8g199940 [Beta vulgaris subsp. vulgaris]|uniref:Uncharacterized protein n=1 Tax=Beta vulgaris subsp. vulgaris TaxID=3555 RepID=A0A0J8BA82_BETVV|nr:hypothetical protein BVRB_8g199940 [Beta vulgaris subsp. vulgaris]